jgi:hypothetical protein
MRRGLISWSKAELPESVLDGRVARAQAAMAQAKVDALAVYSDPARGAGASWLSAFMPYWNRGVLIVPKSGRPTLFTGMSNRVHGWIKRNANLAEVIYSTNLGDDVGRFVAQATAGAVIAVPDLPAIPGPVIDGLTTNGASVVDGTNLLAGLRASADPSELALFFKAASITHTALAAGSAKETDAGALVAAIDGDARRHGAEEVYVAVAPDLGKSRTLYRLEGATMLGARFAVRLSLAYKSTWVRMTRTFARDTAAADDVAQATEQFADAISVLPKTDGLARFPSWLIEGCRSTQPLEAFAGKLLTDGIEIVPGAVVSVQATIDMSHGPVLVGAPVLTGRNGERASLLVPPSFNE